MSTAAVKIFKYTVSKVEISRWFKAIWNDFIFISNRISVFFMDFLLFYQGKGLSHEM